MFACEHDGVVPNVIAVAKGLSGGLVRGRVRDDEAAVERAYGGLDRYDAHSATFSGGPLACAAGIATLEVIARDGLVARAAELGEVLGCGLRRAAEGPPAGAGGARPRPALGHRAQGAGRRRDREPWWAVARGGMMERRMVTQVATQAPECSAPSRRSS